MEITSTDLVRRYFDEEAERFDAIYRDQKRFPQKVVDRLFHEVIHRRFALTLEHCGRVEGKRVLEIGCGSGRYVVEFARRGAQVVGLDLAPAMIEIARSAAQQAGVSDQCRLEKADFSAWCEPHNFEISLAIGLFDYISDPFSMLTKIRHVTTETGVFSFPIRWTLRSLPRWFRLTSRHCPVYFYGRTQVVKMMAGAGWSNVKVTRLSRDYLVYAMAS